MVVMSYLRVLVFIFNFFVFLISHGKDFGELKVSLIHISASIYMQVKYQFICANVSYHCGWAGIIRKTRTVMECLHRFCRECIDKSMRMGY